MSSHCIIPGGQRCGSTYLYKLVSNFNNIILPTNSISEPKFFLDEKSEIASVKDYLSDVFGTDQIMFNKIYLEKSTSYFHDKNAANRIKGTLGDLPIVIIIRNPIARALSHYRFSRTNGFEDLEFNKAIYLNPTERSYQENKVSTNPFNYIENGLYYKHLTRWIDNFARVKIVFLEELVVSPLVYLEVCEFLDLSIEIGEKLWSNQKVNEALKFSTDIQIRELNYLRKIFSRDNKLLEDLLGRALPLEWNTL